MSVPKAPKYPGNSLIDWRQKQEAVREDASYRRITGGSHHTPFNGRGSPVRGVKGEGKAERQTEIQRERGRGSGSFTLICRRVRGQEQVEGGVCECPPLRVFNHLMVLSVILGSKTHLAPTKCPLGPLLHVALSVPGSLAGRASRRTR